MKLPRVAIAAAMMIALLSGVSFARPSWPQELGLDFWELPRLQNQIEAERKRGVELQRKNAEILARMWKKELVLNDLVDGVIGLKEAGAKFLTLAREWPDGVVLMRTFIPGRTDEESAIRQVISFVDGREVYDARITREFITGLECEAKRLTRK